MKHGKKRGHKTSSAGDVELHTLARQRMIKREVLELYS